MTECLCAKCANSIFCETWAEWKCKKYERRIYEYAEMTECEGFKKRGRDFKEPRCRCEDCLKSCGDESEK